MWVACLGLGLLGLARVGPRLTPPPPPTLTLTTTKPSYFHDEFIEIEARFENVNAGVEHQPLPPLIVHVERSSQPVTTIGGVKEVLLRFPAGISGQWPTPGGLKAEGRWPCPWNAPDDTYQLVLTSPTLTPRATPSHSSPTTPLTTPETLTPQQISFSSTTYQVYLGTFQIARRPLIPIPEPLAILSFENDWPVNGLKPRRPDGTQGDWRSLFDWATFIGANTFWHLASETIYYERPLSEEFPWVTDNLSRLRDVAQEAHRRGIKYGTWVVGYLTAGNPRLAPKYQFAWDYSAAKGLYRTRAISLADPKRVMDIIHILQRLNAIPEMDYIGLDYIRNALGGCELVDEFVRDMEPRLPTHWSSLTRDERMIWLARQTKARRDMRLIDQWQWWRAHRVGKIIRQIRAAVPFTKPFWVFTLSWEKGWQHGQDPVMMQDAGADIDAVMLYEATRPQFNELLRDWHAYVRQNHVNLVVGDVIDWPLHQFIQTPPGPAEFFRRSREAIDRIYADGPARGVFVHDLNRALKGRRGPYNTRQWLQEGAHAVRYLRERWAVAQSSAPLTTSSSPARSSSSPPPRLPPQDTPPLPLPPKGGEGEGGRPG